MTAELVPFHKEIQIGNKIWSLKDFITNDSIVEPERLLSPWLCKGDLWMVFSGPGIGKTFFSLNVAFAVAGGGKFLNWKAPKPSKVLYIDGEMSSWDMRQRLLGIVEAAKRDNNGKLQAAYNNFKGYSATYQDIGTMFPDLANDSGRNTLLKHAKGMDLVVIDNLTTTMRGADPDKAMDWTPMQDTLVELRKQGTAVLLVHHTNKSGDQTGTKAKEAILNGMMKLERPELYSTAHGAVFKIHWTKARGLSGADTAPTLAHLAQDDKGLPEWNFNVLDEPNVFELVRLVKTGEYAYQKELADAMKLTEGRITQLKQLAINDYQLITAKEFANCLRTAKELRQIEEDGNRDSF